MLTQSGVATTPESLVDRVYVPARRGSLQIEMLAAAREAGRVAHVLEPSVAALAAEVAGGRPVLVLLNLGVDAWPIWHYAVVIGFDRERGHWLLRSGTERRETLSARRFDGAWRRASRWGVVLLAPGALPAEARPQDVARSLAHFDGARRGRESLVAWQAAALRWPDAPMLLFGLANARFATGDVAGAEAALRRTLALDPGNVAARNNLAELLARRGCLAAARTEIAEAARRAAGTALQDAVARTEREIRGRAGADAPECPGDAAAG